MIVSFLCLDPDKKDFFSNAELQNTYSKHFSSVLSTNPFSGNIVSHHETNCTHIRTMDIQMREFLQRVVRTFGSPFKAKRERNPHRSAEETLESQTGPLQTGQNDEAQLTSASNDNATSFVKPISILSRGESVTSNKIPRSRASTGYTTQSKSEDPWQLPQMEDHGKDRSHLTDGPSRIIMASDGTKDCAALLLTERMIKEFNQIIDETRKLEIAEKELRQARFKASTAEMTIKELNAELERTEDPSLKKDLSEKIETENQTFVANAGQRESLTELIKAYKGNLEFAQDVFQNIFRRALKDTNLLNLPEVAVDGYNPPEAARDRQDPTTVSETDQSIVSVEELLRRNACDDLEYMRENLMYAQAAFDGRHVRYERALYEYQIELDEGTTSCTQSEFGRLAVERTRTLTRELIDAEADYEEALQRAKALGVLMVQVDQESNFVSDISDGYHISDEASMRVAVDTTFIQDWNDSIVTCGPEELEEPQEPDDWDAQTVGLSDSVSVVDYSRNRKRIDRWREMCGQ